MRYTFDVVDARGEVIEQNLSSEEEAHTYIAMLQDQGHDTASWTIVKNEHYTVKGLGRDPDLH